MGATISTSARRSGVGTPLISTITAPRGTAAAENM
jgi:hypothetical protein